MVTALFIVLGALAVLAALPFVMFYSARLWTVGCLSAKQQFEQTQRGVDYDGEVKAAAKPERKAESVRG